MTGSRRQPELPPDLERTHRRAVRLERVTIGYPVTAVVVVYLTLGSSQAMKAAWIEDLLSFLPPIAFLVASRLRHEDADNQHPFGYHRAVGIAYLVAAAALLVMGAYLVYDSGLKLLLAEHPPIGLVELFGQEICWAG